jgi:SAM-dependent methyltransferase
MIKTIWFAAMTQTWRQIWNGRRIAQDARQDLRELLRVDGFDSGAGRYAVEDFRQYVGMVIERTGMDNETSVYEVGCGAGAFLVGLRERIAPRIVGGCDYAAALLEIAQQQFPGADFSVAEATNIDIVRKYDIVLAHSVFQYFPDFNYAARVLHLMIEKASRIVAILDVPDLGAREHVEWVRRERLSPEVYEAKYAGLEHQYYPISWFGKIADEHDCACARLPQENSNYILGRYRFNIVIRRKSTGEPRTSSAE